MKSKIEIKINLIEIFFLKTKVNKNDESTNVTIIKIKFE